MRIVLHAGLHKSGTTSIQGSWLGAYADHPDAWYPAPPPGPPGHHRLFRPLVGEFVDGAAPDLAGAAIAFHARGRVRQSLVDVIATARQRQVGTLVLSSEILDRIRESDRAGLAAALGDEDVTVVLTATRPVHRWCSGWQTLVKHGLAEYPADAARHVVRFAALERGRLAELADLLPARRVVVRLVRNSPPEPDLGVDLAVALGLPDAPPRADTRPVLNPSLGTDTEVMLRVNRADLALGADREGLDLLQRLRGSGFTYRDAPQLAERYAVPDAVLEAAEVEQAWLSGLSGPEGGRCTLLDPHGVLSTWTDPALPEWYATVSSREAVVPELDAAAVRAGDRETQLWRARQERAAYRKLAQRPAERRTRS